MQRHDSTTRLGRPDDDDLTELVDLGEQDAYLVELLGVGKDPDDALGAVLTQRLGFDLDAGPPMAGVETLDFDDERAA